MPHLNLGVLESALLHDLGGAELVAAVDDVNLAAVLGQEGGLLHGRVPPADDGQGCPPEHRSGAIANRARTDAAVPEPAHLA